VKERPPTEPIGELQLWTSGDQADEASVSLAYYGSDVEPDAPERDPDLVGRLLQVVPTRAEKRGAMVPDPRFHRIARTSRWRLQGPRLSRPPEELIHEFLEGLPPPGPVWEELRPFKGCLFCGLFLQFWNRECHLSPGILAEVAARP
jgi:hypothetical protein